MSRRQLPACDTCGRPIARHQCKRAGDASKFCSLACAGIGRRRLGEDEVLLIVTARRLGVTWPTIAAELGCSVSTLQRSLRRAQAPVRLPRWVEREVSPSAILNPQRSRSLREQSVIETDRDVQVTHHDR